MGNTKNTYWDFDAMLAERGVEYLEDKKNIRIVEMWEAKYLLSEDEEDEIVQSIAQKIYYGGHYDGDKLHGGDFEYWNECVIEYDGGWYSCSAEDRDGFIRRMINEDAFYDWCVDWGYVDNGEEDEEL